MNIIKIFPDASMAAANLLASFLSQASLSSLSIFLCQLIMSVHFGAYIAQNLELLRVLDILYSSCSFTRMRKRDFIAKII